ncbi:hypothetical protein M514_23469 [Trichuris suis]|uniref:Uncharacterized protein n=1 Tax=Trichuris suis TaxID=68888 RepID=A0A085N4A5_9BILA|nr:hypothetical protein M514_23469 [Trichuris suis]
MDGGGQNPESRNPDSITAGVLLPSVICEEERIAGNHIFFLPAVKGLHCTARNALLFVHPGNCSPVPMMITSLSSESLMFYFNFLFGFHLNSSEMSGLRPCTTDDGTRVVLKHTAFQITESGSFNGTAWTAQD